MVQRVERLALQGLELTCNGALLLALVAMLGLLMPAQSMAADIPPPPGFQSVDRFGVELSSGSVQIASPTISIGNPGKGGLSYTATWDTSAKAWRSSIWGGVNKAAIKSDPNCFAFITVTALGQTGTFQQDTCTGAYELKDGLGTLTRSGNIWTYTGPDGSVATYDYAQRTTMGAKFSANQGMITSITRPNGEIISFTWLGFGNPLSVTNNFGYQLHFDYGAEGLSGVTALNNAVDACAPTAASCSYSTTWPSLTFTAVGNERRVQDALGHTTRLIFDNPFDALPLPRLIGVARPTAGTGASVTYTNAPMWPLGTRVSAASDGAGSWNYAYEPWVCNNLPGDLDPTSCPLPDYDYTLKTTVTAPGGAQTLYHYTWRHPAFSLGETTHSLDGVTDVNNKFWELYIDGGGLTSVGYPEGNRVSYNRDYVTGAPTGVTLSAKPGSGLANSAMVSVYPACSANPVVCRRPESVTDANGHITTYTYDTAGNVLTEKRPAPVSNAVQPETRYAYELRHAWYKRDGSASITENPNPVWVQVEQSQCATGATCDGLASETLSTITYQAGNASTASNILPLTVSMGAGDGTLTATTTTTYDSVGNVLTVDGPLAGTADTTRYVYDVMRQRVGQIAPDPDGAGVRSFPATRTDYNADGQPTSTQVGFATAQSEAALNAMTVLQRTDSLYDAQGRKIRDTSYGGSTVIGVTQYAYDSVSRLTCTATRMNPATWSSLPASACSPATTGDFGPDRIVYNTYDAADRLLTTTSGYGVDPIVDRTVTYTDNGKAQTEKDGENNLTTYAYDGFDRLERAYYPNSAKGSGSSNIGEAGDYEAYGYDANGNRTSQRRRDNRIITWVYDNLDRPKTKTLAATPATAAATYTYGYDNLGRMISANEGAQTITSVYDALSRLKSETGPLGAVSYTYDVASRRIQMTWPGSVALDYEYDNSGALNFIRRSSTVVAQFGYDDLGRRTSLIRNGVTTSYGYDAALRLSSLSHNLDGSGEDVTFGFLYNPASQIRQRTISNLAYVWMDGYAADRTYGSNGLNQMTSAGSASTQWSVRGNLQYDGAVSYKYDLENRLRGVTTTGADLIYDPLGRLYQTTTAAGVVTRYLYDGSNIIAEYDGSNILLRRYVHGSGADELLARYNGTSTAAEWLFADHQGSIVAATNSSGVILTHMTGAKKINTYDEYGAPGHNNDGLFQYTGQVWLGDLSLYHYKARAYSPFFGRFLQTDPAGYGDGLNWYAYTRNDPLNRFDSNGRDSIAVHYRDQPIHYRNSTIPQWISQGHSGVVSINDRTGVTTYREFGRYDGDPGKIRTIDVPDLVMKKGVPTAASVEALLGSLLKHGANSLSANVSITYDAGSDAGKMDAYAAQVAKDDPNWSWPAGMNCHNFCSGTVRAGGQSGEQVTSTVTKDNMGAVAGSIVGAAQRQCLRAEEQGGCSTK